MLSYMQVSHMPLMFLTVSLQGINKVSIHLSACKDVVWVKCMIICSSSRTTHAICCMKLKWLPVNLAEKVVRSIMTKHEIMVVLPWKLLIWAVDYVWRGQRGLKINISDMTLISQVSVDSLNCILIHSLFTWTYLWRCRGESDAVLLQRLDGGAYEAELWILLEVFRPLHHLSL